MIWPNPGHGLDEPDDPVGGGGQRREGPQDVSRYTKLVYSIKKSNSFLRIFLQYKKVKLIFADFFYSIKKSNLFLRIFEKYKKVKFTFADFYTG